MVVDVRPTLAILLVAVGVLPSSVAVVERRLRNYVEEIPLLNRIVHLFPLFFMLDRFE